MQTETIHVYRIEELAAEYGMEPDVLRDRLSRLNVPVIQAEGYAMVPAASWRALVRQIIERATGGSSGRGWGEGVRQAFRNHPDLEPRMERLIDYLESNQPGIAFEHHASTITILRPDRRRAGLRPRARGIQMYAISKGKLLENWVRSDSDFAGALSWLGDLPGY